MDEKLELSVQDLGRLARDIGHMDAILNWLLLHATTQDEANRVTAALLEGYDET